MANVNRWRGQLGLQPMFQADLDKDIKSLEVQGGKAMLIDMTGTDARSGEKARLVGAIVSQAGRTWFYKLMGDSRVVEQQKDAFIKFVQTVRY